MDGIGFTGLFFFQKTYLELFLVSIPILLYFYAMLKNRTIKFPMRLSLLFLSFIVFSFISSFFSIDKTISVHMSFYFFAVFLIFIFAYNFHSEAKKIIHAFLLLLSLPFILVWVCLFLLNDPANQQTYMSTGRQLIFPFYPGHNHLGDLLGASILLLVAAVKTHRKFPMLALFIFFFLISFSRSAYLSLFICLCLLLLYLFKRKLIDIKRNGGILILSLLILIFFFFSVVHEGKPIEPILQFQSIFNRTFLGYKGFLSGRPAYFTQASQTIRHFPLWGVGPGNFIYASKLFAAFAEDVVDNAFNVFLHFFAEIGIFAGICFVLMMVLFTISAFRQKTIYALLFLYFLVNFQTDYTFTILSLFILLFMLAGVFYHEKKHFNGSSVYGIFAFMCFTWIFILISSTIQIRSGNFGLALLLYPLNKDAYEKQIEKKHAQGNYNDARILVKRYYSISPLSIQTLLFLANYYNETSSTSEALRFYRQIYANNRYAEFNTVIKPIYLLEKGAGNEKGASEILSQFLQDHDQLKYDYDNFRKQVVDFCIEQKDILCKARGWDK
ncbi:MAG: O-antigen ligase family protein [Patescibacteria group bacterium]